MKTNIYFGPVNSGSALTQLRLPETITKVVKYENFEVEYVFNFDGSHLRVVSMKINSSTGILTQDLVRLQIPKLAREIVYEHNPELLELIKNGNTDKLTLAQLYWAEYVCQGKPREVFRAQLGIARNTANYHLRNLESMGLVPAGRERTKARHA